MTKYRVYGTTTVSVVKEVWANSEDEAYEKADRQLNCLTAFCGNGGTDKLIGVYEESESIASDDVITYDDCEVIEDDPNYFECIECDEECDVRETDNGMKYYECPQCGECYDENGNEVYFDEEEE